MSILKKTEKQVNSKSQSFHKNCRRLQGTYVTTFSLYNVSSKTSKPNNKSPKKHQESKAKDMASTKTHKFNSIRTVEKQYSKSRMKRLIERSHLPEVNETSLVLYPGKTGR